MCQTQESVSIMAMMKVYRLNPDTSHQYNNS